MADGQSESQETQPPASVDPFSSIGPHQVTVDGIAQALGKSPEEIAKKIKEVMQKKDDVDINLQLAQEILEFTLGKEHSVVKAQQKAQQKIMDWIKKVRKAIFELGKWLGVLIREKTGLEQMSKSENKYLQIFIGLVGLIALLPIYCLFIACQAAKVLTFEIMNLLKFFIVGLIKVLKSPNAGKDLSSIDSSQLRIELLAIYNSLGILEGKKAESMNTSSGKNAVPNIATKLICELWMKVQGNFSDLFGDSSQQRQEQSAKSEQLLKLLKAHAEAQEEYERKKQDDSQEAAAKTRLALQVFHASLQTAMVQGFDVHRFLLTLLKRYEDAKKEYEKKKKESSQDDLQDEEAKATLALQVFHTALYEAQKGGFKTQNPIPYLMHLSVGLATPGVALRVGAHALGEKVGGMTRSAGGVAEERCSSFAEYVKGIREAQQAVGVAI